MKNNVSKTSSEKPLQGAVLCCTSVNAEQRAVLAEYAVQMGADHTLDLTSDVTHLIVGQTATPKYQYVACHREDVRVLWPDWILAVRERWMADQPIDLNALEAQHAVPPFAGLQICITGFKDMAFRAEMQKKVDENGGIYCADLSKSVTHLIVDAPEGKKYEYACAWGQKIVVLQWFKDTLERGMQLDEKLYGPHVPVDKIGVGAWNRKAKSESALGKRTRDEPQINKPARRLRRTVSAKLSSQSESMWNDIVAKETDESSAPQAAPGLLRPSRSLSTISQHNQQPGENKGVDGGAKWLYGRYFALEGFNTKQKPIVAGAIVGNGAEIIDHTVGLLNDPRVDSDCAFVLVPHQTQPGSLPPFEQTTVKPTVITELWLELCMDRKTFVPPSEYPLGMIIPTIQTPEIKTLVINASGFLPIVALHISKAVVKLGAQYTESFTSKTSLLICNSNNINSTKLEHAKEWKTPVVTERWLWVACQTGTLPSFAAYSLYRSEDEGNVNDLQKQFDKKRREHKIDSRTAAQPTRAHSDSRSDFEPNQDNPERTIYPLKTKLRKSEVKAEAADQEADGAYSVQTSRQASNGRALREIPSNSPKKVHAPYQDREFAGGTVVGLDGAGEQQENGQTLVQSHSESIDADFKRDSPIKPTTSQRAINTAIQELLNLKGQNRSKTVGTDDESDHTGRSKKKLLGRALSNLSNASHGSNPRQSRASSIDSMNTDGVGHELDPLSATTSKADTVSMPSSRTRHMSFQGSRALPQQTPTTGYGGNPLSVDLSDPNLLVDDFKEPEYQQLTQLGYQDSDEAIRLRELLAEKRRQRTKIGQQQLDDTPLNDGSADREDPQQQQQVNRVIRDDEAVVELERHAGWGVGKRTRAKSKGRNMAEKS